MKPWLRMLMIWLLALALPAQGLAAATMAVCQFRHGAPATTPAATGPCAEHATAVPPTQAVMSDHTDGHTCGVCAVCCSAAAVHGIAWQVPESGVTQPVFTALVPTVEKFSASGPDRPPRASGR